MRADKNAEPVHLHEELVKLQAEIDALQESLAKQEEKKREFDEKDPITQSFAQFREWRRNAGFTSKEKDNEKVKARATRIGCKVFLMSNVGQQKSSKEEKLYLYHGIGELFYYTENGRQVISGSDSASIFKAIQDANLKFDQTRNDPHPCDNLDVTSQVLAITLQREHTYGLGRDDVIRKHKSDINLKEKERIALIKEQIEMLKKQKTEEVEEKVVVMHMAPETVFSKFAAYLTENSGHKKNFNRNLDAPFETGRVGRLFDDLQKNELKTLLDLESHVVLSQSIFEIKEDGKLKQCLKQFVIDDLVKTARKAILADNGELSPDLVNFLDQQSENRFSERYKELSPEAQERVKNSLIFSFAHAGIMVVIDDCVARANTTQGESIRLIQLEIGSLMTSSPSLSRVASSSAAFFGVSSTSPIGVAHTLTNLCKRTLVEALDEKEQSEKMPAYYNRVVQYVQNEILNGPSPIGRAETVKYWINVADECFKKGDFHTLRAIHDAFLSTPIYRLNETFSLLDGNVKGTLEKLKEVCKSSAETMKQIEAGRLDVVPFFGSILTLRSREKEFEKAEHKLNEKDKKTLVQYDSACQKVKKDGNTHLISLPLTSFQKKKKITELPARLTDNDEKEKLEKSKQLEGSPSQQTRSTPAQSRAS